MNTAEYRCAPTKIANVFFLRVILRARSSQHLARRPVMDRRVATARSAVPHCVTTYSFTTAVRLCGP
jgi:hypothetical protein